MVNLLNILTFFKDSKGLSNMILLLGILYNGYCIQQTTDSIKRIAFDAETNYAMQVIEYGLGDLTDPQEVYNQISIWHKNEWGAQIGALRTICKVEPNRLEELVDMEVAKSICRLARS